VGYGYFETPSFAHYVPLEMTQDKHDTFISFRMEGLTYSEAPDTLLAEYCKQQLAIGNDYPQAEEKGYTLALYREAIETQRRAYGTTALFHKRSAEHDDAVIQFQDMYDQYEGTINNGFTVAYPEDLDCEGSDYHRQTDWTLVFPYSKVDVDSNTQILGHLQGKGKLPLQDLYNEVFYVTPILLRSMIEEEG
jgi:hypothetical protein